MRLLHTSDWHLGRLFHGVHLTPDQAHVMDQIVAIAADAKVDAVIVAGDIYDRAVPPPEAVALLDEVLARLVRGHGIPVLAIAGNHDSPHRIGFGSRLFAAGGLHLAGRPAARPHVVSLADAHGPVHVYALPYAEPAVVREALEAPAAVDHPAAMAALLATVRAAHPGRARSVVVAHAFVTGATESESERPLSVGGADRVEASVFDGFTYVALGHLHRAQAPTARVQYCGSPLKYAFSEVEARPSVSLVEIDAEGGVRVERVPLSPRRDVRVVTGAFAELLAAEPSEDYLMVLLTDRGPILDAQRRLSATFPNLLETKRAWTEAPGAMAAGRDHRRTSKLELFEAFARETTGTPLTEAERDAVAAVLAQLDRAERESE